VVFDHSVIDWTAVRDARGDSGVIVGELLDRLGQEPDAALWREIDSRLVVEAECFCSAGFAALPALSQLAQSGDTEQRDRALDLAAVITRTLHRNHEDDRLVRASPQALAVLHHVARSPHRLSHRTCDSPATAGHAGLRRLHVLGLHQPGLHR
jgi:hypothetical protein